MGMVNTWDKFYAQSVPDAKLLLFLSLPLRLTFQNEWFFYIVGNWLASVYRPLSSSGTEIIIVSVIFELIKKFLTVLCFLGWLKLPWLKVPVPFLSQEVAINFDPLKILVMDSEVVFSTSAETAD